MDYKYPGRGAQTPSMPKGLSGEARLAQACASDCLCSLTFARAKLLGCISISASSVVPSRAFLVWGLLLVWLFLMEEPAQNHPPGFCCPQLAWHSHLLLPGSFPSPGPAPGAPGMGLDPSAAPDLLYLQQPLGTSLCTALPPTAQTPLYVLY